MGDVSKPEILWAQRSSASDPAKNILYVTVDLRDIQEGTLVCKLTPTSLHFSATAGTGDTAADYAADLDFYAEIDPQKSSQRLTSRSLSLVLRKSETKEEYWPRLTKDRAFHVKTDFDKWVDQDEQDGRNDASADDFGMMNDMGGLGSMTEADIEEMRRK
ncbi:p23/wos2 family protein [Streptomyces sp. NPDC002640]